MLWYLRVCHHCSCSVGRYFPSNGYPPMDHKFRGGEVLAVFTTLWSRWYTAVSGTWETVSEQIKLHTQGRQMNAATSKLKALRPLVTRALRNGQFKVTPLLLIPADCSPFPFPFSSCASNNHQEQISQKGYDPEVTAGCISQFNTFH